MFLKQTLNFGALIWATLVCFLLKLIPSNVITPKKSTQFLRASRFLMTFKRAETWFHLSVLFTLSQEYILQMNGSGIQI